MCLSEEPADQRQGGPDQESEQHHQPHADGDPGATAHLEEPGRELGGEGEKTKFDLEVVLWFGSLISWLRPVATDFKFCQNAGSGFLKRRSTHRPPLPSKMAYHYPAGAFRSEIDSDIHVGLRVLDDHIR